MRVLIGASTFPLRADDGTPRFVSDLAQALCDSAAVTVLAPHAAGAARCERWGDVQIRRFRYFWPEQLQQLAYGHGIRANMRASLLARVEPPFFLVAQACATRALAIETRASLVNSHWLVPQGLSSAIARGMVRERPRFRHVLTVHAGDVQMLASVPGGNRIARFVVGRSDAVLAVGTHVRDSLDRLLGRPSGAQIEPMGATLALWQAESPLPSDLVLPREYLIFVGRFAEKKGVDYLLQAMPRVRAEHSELGLLLVGYGELEAELRERVRSLNLVDAVVFAGRRSHSELVACLRGARAAVVPSIVDRYGETEGMPTVVAEALASGQRVVATAVDGIPDLIRHRENGWLCREKDPEALAGCILEALRDAEPSEIRSRARATAQRLDWTQVAARYAAVFREVLERDSRKC
jgi:glycosyltransferase involved in cell wall biosynthesis